MRTQAEKAAAFRALHEREKAFILPNPWDLGTTRILELMGFEALATTSAGFALSIGKRDGEVGRAEMLAHARAIAAATELPVSADLENCYADDPKGVAETVKLAVAAGLAGCSVEDMPQEKGREPYEIELAAERVRAAAEAAHAAGFPFTLTARAENFIVGRPDLHDTIARLKAYAEAGADVVYAPGLITKQDIQAAVHAVDKPMNVLMGLAGCGLTLEELSEIGVKRVSTGSALARAAIGAFVDAAREMSARGTFTFAEKAAKTSDYTVLGR